MNRSIPFLLDHFLPLRACEKYCGLQVAIPDAPSVVWEIQEHLGIPKDEAVRVFAAMNEDSLDFCEGYDFAKPNGGIFSHKYVLPGDKNKSLVWLTDKFLEQRYFSAKWLLSNFKRVQSGVDIDLAIKIIVAMAQCLSDGLLPFDIVALEKKIDGFIPWMDQFYSRYVSINYKPIILTYIYSLIMEHNDMVKILGSFYERRIKQAINEYLRSRQCTQAMIRQNKNLEITRWINICLYFDILPNPDLLLSREWKTWPLKYLGYSLSKVEGSIDFELCYRISRGKSLDYRSIMTDYDKSERIKMRHLLGNIKKNTSELMCWTAGTVGFLVDWITKNSKLTTYEAVRLAGHFSVYRDGRGHFVSIANEQVEFFFALQELGLRPYRPTRSECQKIYGCAMRSPGFCLGVFDFPHAVQLVSADKCIRKVRTSGMLKNMKEWKNSQVLTIWWSYHLSKPDVISASVLKDTIAKLAEKGVPLAIKICTAIC